MNKHNSKIAQEAIRSHIPRTFEISQGSGWYLALVWCSFSYQVRQEKKQKQLWSFWKKGKILGLSPPTVSSLIRNLCYFADMLMQIFHALLVVMSKNRGNRSSCGCPGTVCVCACVSVCVSVWNILYEGLGVISELLSSPESTVHAWVTCWISMFVLCRGYGVQR